MFDGSAQRDCVERALESSASVEDARQARPTFELACRLDDAGACAVLGVLHEHGRDGRVDLPRARAAYERACDLGDTRGCARGTLLAMRTSGGAQRESAARALEGYCDHGDRVACAALVEAMGDSEVARPTSSNAIHVLWRACDRGDASACLTIGDWLHRQSGQETVAREHWARACGLGAQVACRRHVVPPTKATVASVD
jgi:TPR repeat protein